jgi:hypothetical protein
MSRGLSAEHAARVRQTVRELVASGFNGNISAAARAIGMTSAGLGDFLRGARGLGAASLVKISAHTGLSLDALVGVEARAASSAVPTPSSPEAESEIRRSGDAAEPLTGGRGTPLSDGPNCWSSAPAADTFDGERGSDMRKPTEITPSTDDRARVQLAKDRHGVKQLVSRSGASESAVTRVLAGMPVKRATLSVVVRAADELEAERARKLAPKHGGGPL